MPGALHRDPLPAPGAGEAEHAAHLAVAARVLEERLRDPLRAQRVSGEQDEGCDVAGGGSDVGAHWPETNVSQGGVPARAHGRRSPRPHRRTPSRRRVARGAVGRSGHPGAGRLRHPRAAPGRPDPLGEPARTRPRDCGCCWGSTTAGPGSRSITGPEVAQAAKDEWFPLRGLLPHLADQDLAGAPLVFHALGLAEWLFVTRFCPRCGGRCTPQASGHELVCANCGTSQFPRTDPAVIMVVTSGEPGQRGRALPPRPPGDLAGGPLLDPGGLLRAGGDPRGRRTPRGAGGDRGRGG